VPFWRFFALIVHRRRHMATLQELAETGGPRYRYERTRVYLIGRLYDRAQATSR
jgi:hypothetical protein